MHRAYLVPSSSTAKPGESEALEVLAFILGHGNTSRLYRALVDEQGLAVGAGGWYSGTALDATQFGVYGSPKPGVELQQLEAAIDAVIDDLLANGVTAEEVERATSRLIADVRLRPGQSGDHGALVRRGAHHRAAASSGCRAGPTASAR